MNSANGSHNPTNDDLELVRRLGEYRDSLIEQLRQCEDQLKEAWKKVPYDPEINRRPYLSDISSKCRNCGRPTKWVHPKGYALHYAKYEDGKLVAECPPDRLGKTTEGISEDIWQILDMPDSLFAEGKEDETLEIITKASVLKKASDKLVAENRRPSEREN